MDEFPIHHLGGDHWLWECPTSAVPDYIWDALDLFWLCHSRIPGQGAWALQRTGYPREGSVLQQDSWLMWSFSILELAFYSLQADQAREAKEGRHLAEMHAQVLLGARAGK